MRFCSSFVFTVPSKASHRGLVVSRSALSICQVAMVATNRYMGMRQLLYKRVHPLPWGSRRCSSIASADPQAHYCAVSFQER